MDTLGVSPVAAAGGPGMPGPAAPAGAAGAPAARIVSGHGARPRAALPEAARRVPA